MKILADTSLKPFHTFAIDVHAKKIIEAHDVKDFLQIFHQYANEPMLLVGEGSNLLFCEDFDGVVILNRLKGIKIKETDSAWLLHVAGGENWHDLVRWTLDNEMPGLENLALIPGLVGSAPIQNIGAYGVEFCEHCDYVDVLMLATGEIQRFSAAECEFGYRDSIFKRQLKNDAIIVAVGFSLPKLWKPVLGYGGLSGLVSDVSVTAKTVFNKICEIRREKLPDPNVVGNAGSFFKNPIVNKSLAESLKVAHDAMPWYVVNDTEVKLAAGWLIEHAGLKGRTFGGAAVHDKQALVLINQGTATSSDVIQLAQLVVDTVLMKFGVKLEHEVRFIGKTHEITLAVACQS